MRKLNAWLQIFRTFGGGLRAGRQIDLLFRYFVLKTLDEIDFFTFIQAPRTYGEILAEFNFIDGDYPRELIGTLVNDPNPMVLLSDEVYYKNLDEDLPSIELILSSTDHRFRRVQILAEDLSENILDRLKGENASVQEIFEREENKIVNMLHEAMGIPVYSKIRSAVFALLPRAERKWIRGKDFLEVGCGSGRETAELWNMFHGDIHITAIDPVPKMLDLAIENFPRFLKDINPDHPPLNELNQPVFELGDAMLLPFEDDSFDVSFWVVMLQWVSSPKKVIEEAARVVRPGGLIIGNVAMKPYVNPYVNLVIRSSRNSYGAFWKEEYIQWFREVGLRVEVATPVGLFRARNEPAF